jgi:hypothetical protein
MKPRCFTHEDRIARWPASEPVFCTIRCAAREGIQAVKSGHVLNAATGRWVVDDEGMHGGIKRVDLPRDEP